MTPFETFQKYYKNRWDYNLVARDWKEKGGKIIGYPDINFPEELAIAAGCRPLLMTGNPDSGIETVQNRMDDASSLPFRYFYEAIISGKYDFVDIICATRGEKWFSYLYNFLTAEKALYPALKFGEIYYLERVRATFKQHRDYNLARLLEFKTYLEKCTGREITNEALTAACKETNETRRLLKQVSTLRKQYPPRISGTEALQIILASMLIPKAVYNKLLQEFLEKEVNSLPKKDTAKKRIFVSGSSIDNLQLYELIESLPAVVVGEDFAFGDRYSETPINIEIEPMEALADRYTYKPLDPWMYGMKDRIQYKINTAEEAKIHGEIFFHLAHDDDVGWDYPDQRKGLEEHDIPVLLLEDQEYKISNKEELQEKLKAFINTIK